MVALVLLVHLEAAAARLAPPLTLVLEVVQEETQEVTVLEAVAVLQEAMVATDLADYY